MNDIGDEEPDFLKKIIIYASFTAKPDTYVTDMNKSLKPKTLGLEKVACCVFFSWQQVSCGL